MVSIEVGTTRITWCDGRTVELDSEAAPVDLVLRVADGATYAQVNEYGCVLRPAHELFATLVADALHGHPLSASQTDPVRLVVPAWWSGKVQQRVGFSLTRLGYRVSLVNDAEAAVAEMHQSGIDLPETIAVVHLRAAYVGVSIVKTSERPVVFKRPTLVHPEGGNSLDAALLRHLVRGLQDVGDTVAVQSQRVITAARAALRDCRDVREALSVDATAILLPNLPGASSRVRLVRSELEDVAKPWADKLIEAVSTALEQSPVPVEAILATGGLASMPLVSQRLSADLSLDVFVPDDPAHASLRGAARLSTVENTPAEPSRSLWRFITRHKPRAKHTSRGAQSNPTNAVANTEFAQRYRTSRPLTQNSSNDRSHTMEDSVQNLVHR